MTLVVVQSIKTKMTTKRGVMGRDVRDVPCGDGAPALSMVGGVYGQCRCQSECVQC